MTISKKLLRKLHDRRAKALAGGGAEKNEERRRAGRMTARDRVGHLYDRGTFQEFGLHVQHRCRDFGMEGKPIPADAVVVGLGYVGGRPVTAFSQDFTVAGGTLGRLHATKITEAMENALRLGTPVVCFNDSGGARIQEAVDSLSGYGRVFNLNVQLSGVVPQIAVIAGPCAGGAAYSPALCDWVIMTREHANMFICGPEVIKAATGQDVTMKDIGGADVHAGVSGNAHFIAADDADAVRLVKALLAYMPSNNLLDPPHDLSLPVDTAADPEMNRIVPEKGAEAYDVKNVIARLVDRGEFLEVHASFARNLVVGFARICGVVVGIVANQPSVMAGTLDIDSSDKGARFVRFCNLFNIPLVTLVDTPGFMPGLSQERGGIIRHGAKMLFAYASASVPKITVILRKAYGGAYLAMCSKDMDADVVLAWPTAEVAVMGADGAVNILYRKELKEAADPKARREELIEEYRERFASPYQAAEAALVSDIIEPSETRAAVALALRTHISKRVTRPPKKHGNIPL
jgi:propionyl-CoA carboxylase beta chain